jgi:hypothetical protein
LGGLLSRNADHTLAKIGHTGDSTGKPLAFWCPPAGDLVPARAELVSSQHKKFFIP